MRNDEAEKFLTLINGIGEYYGRKLSSAILDVYWEGLKNFDFDAVSKALYLHTSNPDSGQYFPKIADIVRHIEGGNADRALTAWSKVDKAVRTIGDYRSVVFDDAIIHAVIVDMGGWVGFGNCEMENWPFKQNEFAKRYRGYLERGGAGKDYPSKLIGQVDMRNRQIGYADDGRETALLGDHKRALEVMRLGNDGDKKNQVTLLSEQGQKHAGSFVRLGEVKAVK